MPSCILANRLPLDISFKLIKVVLVIKLLYCLDSFPTVFSYFFNNNRPPCLNVISFNLHLSMLVIPVFYSETYQE